jgi:hypothetical protein
MLFEESLLALYYLCESGGEVLESPGMFYGKSLEEQETAELAAFVEMASRELRKREHGPERNVLVRKTVGNARIRITGNLRIYVGAQEVRVRPMAKCVLLLFLKHPEGIVLKSISDYSSELAYFYRRVSRSDNPSEIANRVQKLLDICTNNLNINISRANAAMAGLVDEPDLYTIKGTAGRRKTIRLSRSLVVWE